MDGLTTSRPRCVRIDAGRGDLATSITAAANASAAASHAGKDPERYAPAKFVSVGGPKTWSVPRPDFDRRIDGNHRFQRWCNQIRERLSNGYTSQLGQISSRRTHHMWKETEPPWPSAENHASSRRQRWTGFQCVVHFVDVVARVTANHFTGQRTCALPWRKTTWRNHVSVGGFGSFIERDIQRIVARGRESHQADQVAAREDRPPAQWSAPTGTCGFYGQKRKRAIVLPLIRGLHLTFVAQNADDAIGDLRGGLCRRKAPRVDVRNHLAIGIGCSCRWPIDVIGRKAVCKPSPGRSPQMKTADSHSMSRATSSMILRATSG